MLPKESQRALPQSKGSKGTELLTLSLTQQSGRLGAEQSRSEALLSGGGDVTSEGEGDATTQMGLEELPGSHLQTSAVCRVSSSYAEWH